MPDTAGERTPTQDLIQAERQPPADSTPAVDFAIVLSRVISAVKEDPTELRHAIYELARAKLRQESFQRTPPVGILEMRRLSIALETAITRVEAHSSKQAQLQALKSLDRLIEDISEGGTNTAAPLIDVTPEDERGAVLPFRSATPTARPSIQPSVASNLSLSRGLTSAMRVGMVAFAALLLVAIAAKMQLFGHRDPSQTRSPSAASHASTKPAVVATEPSTSERAAGPASQTPDPLLPTAYGIYALSGGKLHELEALPGRVPDQRVFMSGIITSSGRTVIPNGRITFIAYRRDFTTNAPSRVAVRVVAKISRALSFNPGGQVEVVPVNDSWAIRNVEHSMRVSPRHQNQEMLLIQPESNDFELSPGRYALVLNGLAYDFVVAGDVTTTAHCLERTVAANGVFYSECRSR